MVYRLPQSELLANITLVFFLSRTKLLHFLVYFSLRSMLASWSSFEIFGVGILACQLLLLLLWLLPVTFIVLLTVGTDELTSSVDRDGEAESGFC